MVHEPWPLVVLVVDADTGEQSWEVQIRCGCLDSLALEYGHEEKQHA